MKFYNLTQIGFKSNRMIDLGSYLIPVNLVPRGVIKMRGDHEDRFYKIQFNGLDDSESVFVKDLPSDWELVDIRSGSKPKKEYPKPVAEPVKVKLKAVEPEIEPEEIIDRPEFVSQHG